MFLQHAAAYADTKCGTHSARPPHRPDSSWNLPFTHFAHFEEEPSPALPIGHFEHCWSATKVQPLPNGSYPTPQAVQSLHLSWPVHSH